MDKLLWCDYLFFFCPINWFAVPAMLKGWIDKVMASGFAYGGGRWYETGIFKDKKAMLVMTTGAPEFMFKADHVQGDIRDICFPITHGVFWFCGFTPLESYFVHSPSHQSEEVRHSMLEKFAEFLRGLETAPIISYRGVGEIMAAHKADQEPTPVMKYNTQCFCGTVHGGCDGEIKHLFS